MGETLLLPLRNLLIALVLPALLPAAAWSQDKWYELAEIRRDLDLIFDEIRELQSALGAAASESTAIFPVSGSIPRRVDALETELRENIAKLEELEHQIRRVAEDGAERISELEFKLVTLEGGDTSILPERTTLGNFGRPHAPGHSAGNSRFIGSSRELTDMDYALLAYSENDYQSAAKLFKRITDSYPGREIASKAHYFHGETLVRMDQWKDAALAYLESYSAWPNGEFAPKALFRLGESLGKIERVEVACMTLRDVRTMFPGVAEATLAETEMTDLDCH
ncbi:MAG: hypothetical protein OXN84_10530 [Albidovulum sp.]|nr:hypothetical protein [Albidovulum sp.]